VLLLGSDKTKREMLHLLEKQEKDLLDLKSNNLNRKFVQLPSQPLMLRHVRSVSLHLIGITLLGKRISLGHHSLLIKDFDYQ